MFPSIRASLHFIATAVSAGVLSVAVSAASPTEETTANGWARGQEVKAGGVERTVDIYVPDSLAPNTSAPLLVVLHGTGSTGAQMVALGRFEMHAERKGFVLAAPNSLGRAFNEGSGRGGPDVKGVDDVAFIEAAANAARQRAKIDPSKMFLAGFSSGGAMAQRMALQSDYPWAAIAAVAGHLWVPAEGAKRPTNLLLFWGMKDPLNPKEGGPVPYPQSGVTLDKPSPSATHLKWADLLECYEGEFAESTPLLGTKRLSIDTCYEGAHLEAYFAGGLGHQWPGGTPLPFPETVVGPYTDQFDLTDVIWDFFSARSGQ